MTFFATRGHGYLASVAAICGACVLVSAAAPARSMPPGSAARPAGTRTLAAPALKPIATPLRLSYGYKVNDTRRYKVTAFFSGHFPPFASAGSPPIHLMIVMDYAAKVTKVTDKGADVDFNVENASLSLLEKEPPDDLRVPPADAAEFPIPLSQVQKMFNATATFKPTGAIANIIGGDTATVKIDLGIDLRKLFLVTAPMILSDKPVKTGDEWPFSDGLLGSKPGKTTYTGRLQSVAGTGKTVTAVVTQQAESIVNSTLDKEGNSTENAGAAVGTLVGKVTLTGTAQLTGAPDPAPGASGRVTEAKLAMVADLKRTLPDPEQAGKSAVTDIDIKARLFVTPAQAGGGIKPKPGTGKTSKPAAAGHRR